MITLNQKQLKKLTDVVATAARLDELNRLEGYVPSANYSRRRSILKKQLADLLGEDNKSDEKTVNIRIEIPEERKEKVVKEKSFNFNLKSLLSGKVNDVEDDDEILVVLKDLLPESSRNVLGRIVKEL